MTGLRQVDVHELPIDRMGPLIGDSRLGVLQAHALRMKEVLGPARIWNLNSTASGGGVAEMLRVLVGYARGTGLDVRWSVIEGDPEFFAITKRVHNRIHGIPGDAGALGPAEAHHYFEVTRRNAELLRADARPGDVVLLHDPQTAGMAEPLAAAGLRVVWRSHIGADRPSAWSEEAWGFLRPHLDACDGYIFSRAAYVPEFLAGRDTTIIQPSIDPFAAKNQALDPDAVIAIGQRVGVLAGNDRQPPVVTLSDGSRCRVANAADIVADAPPLDRAARLVVQVSRWDRLKDMAGVMRGFAEGVVGRVDAHLALVGPAVVGVSDDPEGAEVLGECRTEWERLAPEARRRVRLVSLPMQDVDENALMVNALQRHASVVVQKSLVEGFGLTVAEAMWKGTPVVGSAVGGITDQVAPGTGVLLDDPSDLESLGAALTSLLSQPPDLELMGRAARKHVVDNFLGDRHLTQYALLIERLLGG